MCKLHCTWRKANVNHTLHKENTSCSCPTSSLAFEAISSKNESKVDVKQEYPPHSILPSNYKAICSKKSHSNSKK